jgi:ComF family protein
MARWVYTALDRLADRLLPPQCVLCRQPGAARGRDLCLACEADLPRRSADACPRCGGARSPATVCAPDYANCRGRAMACRTCLAPFAYEFPLDTLVPALKYEGAMANARVLGTLLAEAVIAAGPECRGVDAIVPMPLHASRLVERGFNQSFEIARVVSRVLGLPVLRHGLRRVRATPPQVGLPRSARLANVRGAFAADRPVVAGRTIALLDDVVTTGGTIEAAAGALLAAGASAVDAWCIARASG